MVRLGVGALVHIWKHSDRFKLLAARPHSHGRVWVRPICKSIHWAYLILVRIKVRKSTKSAKVSSSLMSTVQRFICRVAYYA